MSKRKAQTRKQKVATSGQKDSKAKKKLNRMMVTKLTPPEEQEPELGNNGEPLSPTVNEDAQKDAEMGIAMETMEESIKRLEAAKTVKKPLEDEKPFDPLSVVANILKKKDGV